MHESHLREVITGRLFNIDYVSGQHVELSGCYRHTDRINRRYYLTVTAREGATIFTDTEVQDLVAASESIYLSVRDWEPNSNKFITKVAELELLQSDGSLIPSFSDLGDNVVSLRATA